MNLFEELEIMEITEDERKFAQEWLLNTKYLIEGLSNPEYFTKERVKALIKFELEGRKRVSLLKRLHARYGRMRQNEEWQWLKRGM